ncbi:hypothetical protein HF086_005304 [Spodoptera exigua]|uniref:Odorant receptor n=1 Tax=Spodoptera exigua TaxID=7107 RepID=A0A922MYR2_SPOEX|nr:hypothetical protein HF086_005304 [Spodoptera exigua]
MGENLELSTLKQKRFLANLNNSVTKTFCYDEHNERKKIINKLRAKMPKQLLLDKSLDKLGVLFRYSGINLEKDIVSPMDTIKHRWLYALNNFCVVTAEMVGIYYIIDGIIKGKSFIEVTSVAPCLTFSLLALIKCMYHHMYEEQIKELINLLRDLERKENDREECADKQEIIDEEAGFLNKVINVLYVLNCCMIVVFDMTPIVLIAVKYYKTKQFEMLLPYLDVFTIIPYKLAYWPVAYFYQIWSEVMVLLSMAAADYLFFTYCTYIRIQFRLLQYEFERIIPERSISKGERFDEAEFRDKFRELVQWHQDLIRSTIILDFIYSKSTLFNFMSSSLVICLTGFNVTVTVLSLLAVPTLSLFRY